MKIKETHLEKIYYSTNYFNIPNQERYNIKCEDLPLLQNGLRKIRVDVENKSHIYYFNVIRNKGPTLRPMKYGWNKLLTLGEDTV